MGVDQQGLQCCRAETMWPKTFIDAPRKRTMDQGRKIASPFLPSSRGREIAIRRKPRQMSPRSYFVWLASFWCNGSAVRRSFVE